MSVMPRCYNAAVCDAKSGIGYSHMDFWKEIDPRIE